MSHMHNFHTYAVHVSAAAIQVEQLFGGCLASLTGE